MRLLRPILSKLPFGAFEPVFVLINILYSIHSAIRDALTALPIVASPDGVD
jgi:hypothetical protein